VLELSWGCFLAESAKLEPPAYCQYAAGPCNQSFACYKANDAFFAFGSDPSTIASTVQSAVEQLRRSKPNHRWASWKDLTIAGQIVYCEICRTIRHSNFLVADVTTLNFNVMFELGYAIGLGKPVMPVRDTTYQRDARELDELGLLDTLGYVDYANSDQLAAAVLRGDAKPTGARSAADAYQAPPLYVVLPPVQIEGVSRLLSALNRSAFQHRAFDPTETPRLAIVDVQRNVQPARGVVAKLIDPHRKGAAVHNARCAFVAGYALAQQKHVLMIQEGVVKQAVDYRDVCLWYTTPDQVGGMIERFVRQVATSMHQGYLAGRDAPKGKLAKLDLGDVAAENEELSLNAYFVQTAQFRDAFRGHARLVVGRKGTGKSAIFCQIRDVLSRRAEQYLVLDLRPESYQLLKLTNLFGRIGDAGTHEQTVSAFWDYVLLCELAHRIIDADASIAYRDPATLEEYEAVRTAYRPQKFDEHGDFSERLLSLLGNLAERFPGDGRLLTTAEITNAVWTADIAPLREAVASYLRRKAAVWILVDNLDKGWPARGASSRDILLLRGLLEAARKLQRQLAKRRVPLSTVVFIRNDILDRLVEETPDRGKEASISLDLADLEVLKEILRARAVASLGEEMDFEKLSGMFFDRHVGGEDTFKFLYRHTHGRARDVLRVAKRCIDTALNRGHERVLESDVLAAVEGHSNEVLRELKLEVQDVQGERAEVIEDFAGARRVLTQAQVTEILTRRDKNSDSEKFLETLLWYSFLGVEYQPTKEVYSYEIEYNVERMLKLAGREPAERRFVIHPAFHHALRVDRSVD
jgi:nucleoside 2-deoxyribosyltransferase